jgi:hypothetical protein
MDDELQEVKIHHRGFAFDMNINVPTMVTLLGAVAAGAMWVANIQTSQADLESRVATIEVKIDKLPERIAIIEERTKGIERIERKLENQ